jgi:hypothetical protein
MSDRSVVCSTRCNLKDSGVIGVATTLLLCPRGVSQTPKRAVIIPIGHLCLSLSRTFSAIPAEGISFFTRLSRFPPYRRPCHSSSG